MIDFINAWNMDFLQGNVIKYVTRYKLKGGVEDLRKARQYLTWMIVREEHRVVPKEIWVPTEIRWDNYSFKKYFKDINGFPINAWQRKYIDAYFDPQVRDFHWLGGPGDGKTTLFNTFKSAGIHPGASDE